MPLERTDLKYFWDMLTAAQNLVNFCRSKTLEQYQSDVYSRYCVERGIEIIGEAARCVSAEGRAAHPEISWNAIIATRNIIAHEYGEVQNDKVWRIVTIHLPALIDALRPIVDSHPPD